MRKTVPFECLLKRRIVTFFSIPLLLVLPLLIFGQHYNFKNYSIEDGLVQSEVYCLFQDSKGYLWYGTFGGGMGRFDGNTFTNYTTQDGLSDNEVYTIYEDRNGYLWIGTNNGINKYDGKGFTVYTEKNGLSHNNTRVILGDSEGYLWIATYGGGINKFDGTTFTHYTTSEGLNHNNVNWMMQDHQGYFWIGTEKGAAQFDGTTFNRYTVKEGLIDNRVQCILEDRIGQIWFATKKGVCRFDGTTFFEYTTREGLCGNDILFLMEDNNGDLWIATTKGVSHFDGGVFTTYTTREGLGDNEVVFILEDREENIWFGTLLGLTKSSSSPFICIRQEDGLINNVIWSLWEDYDGNMWISSEGGIDLYNEKKSSPVIPLKEEYEGGAYPFYEDRSGNLWYGTEPGLIKYKDGIFTDMSKQTGTVDKEIYCILEDRHGNMWFGTRYNGVTKYDGQTITHFTTQNGLVSNMVNTIVEDKKGHLWIGTEYGIGIFDGEHFTSITTDDWLNNRSVIIILEDPEGCLWIGTFGGGVIRYTPCENPKNAAVDTFTVDDGLLDNAIFLMIFDDDGHLWIGTNKGLSVLNVEEFKKSGRKIFKNYGKQDGFIGMECNQNAVYKDRKGNVWFGTVKGAARYNPGGDKINPVEPSTYITGLKLFFEAVDLSAYSGSHPTGAFLPLGLTLPYSKNHLTFEFVGISFTVPEKVRYQFKLEGFDESWSPVSKATSATYSYLPPGAYTFKVKACNNSGIWNREPVTYCFNILTPFWKQWWFYVLCVIMGGMSIYGFIKIRTRSLERRQQVLERKVQQRTLELKQEKAKVEQVNRELEQRVRERTRELTMAHQQLIQAQKMEAIGTLAGGVAHDLNNALLGIVIYPDLLLEKMSEDSPFRKYILSIKKTGERAGAIVQDLLTLSRRGVAVREMVNLNQAIAECMESPEMGKLKSYHTEVQVETSLEPGLLNISGSPIHLSKTIMNLISNAAESMPEGGKVTISTQNQTLDQPVKGYDRVEKGKYVVLTISDNGVGMSAREIERIFDPFYTKKKMGRNRTGLGMTVVWSTVEDHNGYITVESKEGSGTTVSLYFPASRVGRVKDKYKSSFRDYMGNGESILVVDDIAEQREVVSLMLQEMGYSVRAVSSGEEAVVYISENPVDLLVLDMIMDPGIDGLETYKRILKLYPKQKAIIVSGFSETERIREAQRLGAGPYIRKPYRMIEIGKAIKEELRGEVRGKR
jgi:ligand-binding sensor domain-containing protein/signal transduction histidine kinase/CheY-like chemotaxis protein